MPEIRDKVLQGEATSTGIADQLKELINPMLQADLINRSKTLEDKTDLLSGMIATINTNLSEHGKILEDMRNKFTEFEPVKTMVAKLESNVGLLQTEAHRVANESTAIKS